MSGRPQVIYAGYLVRCPLGGYAAQVVHYLRGLREAGVDVWFYEDTRHTWHAYDPVHRTSGDAYESGIAVAAEILHRAGFGDRWVFYDAQRERWAGAGESAAREIFASARILINAGGVHRFSEDERRGKTAIYIDMDPAYTQLRIAGGDRALAALVGGHDLHFTFGENIGTPRCPIPTGDTQWRPTRQPVALDLWPVTPLPTDAPFTTIGTWDSRERDVSFRGERYSWSKREEWAAILDLPASSGERFAMAMEVRDAADRERLERAGWEIRDPIEISRTPEDYRDFLAASRAEFTTAKDINVRLQSGWFSDRGACYLASGRPVITQDTGFAAVLPVGEGLLSYRSRDEALEAVCEVAADPVRRGLAARKVAEEFFAAKQVVERLLAPV